jgi:hypothetical protein
VTGLLFQQTAESSELSRNFGNQVIGGDEPDERAACVHYGCAADASRAHAPDCVFQGLVIPQRKRSGCHHIRHPHARQIGEVLQLCALSGTDTTPRMHISPTFMLGTSMIAYPFWTQQSRKRYSYQS